MYRKAILLTALLLAGCVETSVMPLSTDTFQINATSDQDCGKSGAQKVAVQVAALETIKRREERFIILGSDGQSSRYLSGIMPIYSKTKSDLGGGKDGNKTNANSHSNTTTTGGVPIFSESHEQILMVRVIREDDPAAEQALVAKAILGPEWAKIVQKGKINTCW